MYMFPTLLEGMSVHWAWPLCFVCLGSAAFGFLLAHPDLKQQSEVSGIQVSQRGGRVCWKLVRRPDQSLAEMGVNSGETSWRCCFHFQSESVKLDFTFNLYFHLIEIRWCLPEFSKLDPPLPQTEMTMGPYTRCMLLPAGTLSVTLF